jgi:hypothetical protein
VTEKKDGEHIEDIGVEILPEPDDWSNEELDPSDSYREGVDKSDSGEAE